MLSYFPKSLLALAVIIISGGVLINAKNSSTGNGKTETRKTKVACVGNSITFGYALKDRENNNYPRQLGLMLGDKYEVGNFGRTGATLMKKGHNPYYNWKEYKEAIEFAPDIVVIHLGVNDLEPRDYPKFGDTFVGDYVGLIDSFRNVNPNVRVIVANLSPLLPPIPRFKAGLRDWRDSVRVLTPVVAEYAGAELIDFGTALRDRPNLIPDNIHPDDKGATVLAETVRKAITGDYGGLQMPPVFSDGMVLQRNVPLNIRGIANAGDKITVSLGQETATAVTDNRGDWSVTLPPFKENTGLTLSISDGTNKLLYKDVAVGEVWLASGQSNMAFPLRDTESFPRDSAMTTDPLLRLFNMLPSVEVELREWTNEEKERMDNLDYYKPTKWESSTPETAKDFSGVAWYFGKMMRDSLNVPVGIIHNAIGGSPTEAWIDIETLEHQLPEILIDWRNSEFVQPWVKERGIMSTGMKDGVPDGHRHSFEPSYLYATGIRPLNAYPIAGVIWYQGESNDHNIQLHEQLFPMMQQSWRNTWENPELPFLYVQLSSVVRPSWPSFRDSQRKMAKTLPNVAMVVSSDKGDSLDIHPKNKRDIGERLGRQALNKIYNMKHVTPQGPDIVKAEQVAPGTIILTFDYAEGLTTSDGLNPRTFEIAEIKDMYAGAETVEILPDNRIKIVNMALPNPRFVRYGWQPVTNANLVNGDGLPASTFKVDVKPLSPIK
ncbi:MAG: sialate O-acetylesterase [Muribaculaceae bacterium]|nr:sialate O-acetylesterase [Muribaculaceae bacterium]